MPIIPGIKIITTKRQLSTIPSKFYCDIPSDLADEIAAAKPGHVTEIGVEWACKQAEDLPADGHALLERSRRCLADQAFFERVTERQVVAVAIGHGGEVAVDQGHNLARLEVGLAIGSLVRRFPDLSGPVEPPAWRRSMIIRGPVALPLRLTG